MITLKCDYCSVNYNKMLRNCIYHKKLMVLIFTKKEGVSNNLAKVTRDRLMMKQAKQYPQYGFEKHKGYLTKVHLEALKQYGPCEIHRLTYKPIKDSVK